ncbi:MAG: tRNA lysidine(34) synthetase TilS [Pseudomonadota bacterium]
MSAIVTQVEQQIKPYYQAKQILVGLSGGLDSVVLLHILQKLKLPAKLAAIHVNHHLHPDADKWAYFCETFCQGLQLVCHQKDIVLGASLHNLEARAREKRYQCFRQFIDENTLLMTAHHRDDQLETVLLQLFRGAGAAGLAAMPMAKSFAEGMHLRPLLNCSRAQIKAYAQTHGLRWMEDSSNLQTEFTRNFLRHEIIPQLTQRWPGIANTVGRVARHQAQMQSLLTQLAQIDYAQVKTQAKNKINLIPLLTLDPLRQKNLLRYFLQINNVTLLNEKKLETLLMQLNQAKADKNPVVSWQSYSLRRYEKTLFLLTKADLIQPTQSLDWQDLTKALILPNDLGHLMTTRQAGQGLKLTAKQKVKVAFRRGGEIIAINNRGRRPLKKLLQEWHVPTWQRGRIPLIFIDDELAQVVGHAIAKKFLTKSDEAGWVVDWNN